MFRRAYVVTTKKRLTPAAVARKHTKDAALAALLHRLHSQHLEEVAACVTGRKVVRIGETQFAKIPSQPGAVDYVLSTEIVYRGWKK